MQNNPTNLTNLRKLGIRGNFSFPQLEFLEFHSLESLEELNLAEGAMLRLRSFRIINCGNLKMLPKATRSLTALRELDIEEMPKSFVDRVRVSAETIL
ncbi:hypothetical protein CRYUN_Cryun12cG0186600 [Craigia yunnanensis]